MDKKQRLTCGRIIQHENVEVIQQYTRGICKRYKDIQQDCVLIHGFSAVMRQIYSLKVSDVKRDLEGYPYGRSVFLRKRRVTQLIKKFPVSTEPKSLPTCS
jgi:hypothetical protein